MRMQNWLLAAAMIAVCQAATGRAQEETPASARPVVPHLAYVRVQTDHFENELEGVAFAFEDSSVFSGRVMWLDDRLLTLEVRPNTPQLKIPLEAITHFEMKIEKNMWPLTLAVIGGGLAGGLYPISERASHPPLNRMYYVAAGLMGSLAVGLIIKRYQPERWMEVPLSQLRYGIK